MNSDQLQHNEFWLTESEQMKSRFFLHFDHKMLLTRFARSAAKLVGHSFKGELNIKINLFLFKHIGIAVQLCKSLFYIKSNNIEKLNVEMQKSLTKGFNTVVAIEIVSGIQMII